MMNRTIGGGKFPSISSNNRTELFHWVTLYCTSNDEHVEILILLKVSGHPILETVFQDQMSESTLIENHQPQKFHCNYHNEND